MSGQRDAQTCEAKRGHDAFRTFKLQRLVGNLRQNTLFLAPTALLHLVLSHPPSMAGAELHTMHVKDLPVSQRRCVVERHGSRCSNCASFQSPTVAPCAARIAKQGDNCLACSYIRQASKFRPFFAAILLMSPAALTDAALQTLAFPPSPQSPQAHHDSRVQESMSSHFSQGPQPTV